MNFVKKNLKKIVSISVAVLILASICVVGSLSPNASGTGAGLAEWALNAYNSGWKYVYGGSSAGAVDCSGLIYSYCGGARVGTDQLNSAKESGNVSAGIPRVHGLGLYQPGHVGVYVGNGMAVDARNEQYGVCYESTATKSWTKWFKLSAVTYINNGWEKFNGNYYYYENGQYLVNTSRTIGGESYSFSSSGIADRTPDNMDSKASKGGSSDSGKSSSKTENKSSSQSSPSVLKFGSSGDAVTKLQNRLTELGFYSDAVTGYFGEATQAAYKEFQKAAGVTVDGIAGESDLEILYSDDAPTADSEDENSKDEDDGTLELGDEGDEVEKVQQKLEELKYFNEMCTGYFGEITERAVKEFQEDNSIDTTGIVGELTMDALFDEATPDNPDYVDETENSESEQNTEPETAPATESVKAENEESTLTKNAKANVEIAQKVIVRTNRISKKALAGVNGDKTDTKTASISTSDEKNTNFILWMLIVLGVVAIVSGLTFTFNKRRTAYSGAHTKSKRKDNVTVRYW